MVVNLEVEGKMTPTELIVLPEARGYRTLLGTDFLRSAGIVLDVPMNYSTTEREALAVVWALEKFRGYVENQEILIASDHQPLKWLMCIKSPSGRLARWALEILSFNPKIEYMPGKSNVLKDMLSRPTNLNEDVPCDVFAISADFPVRRPRHIREEQLKDEELKNIIGCFENSSNDENFANWTSRDYLMNQGFCNVTHPK
ncbi:Retrovirus-related Pol polyprotein like [Argiope bruennichi]|uniref:Retrovirus-related Pol polyprotein like n=1 Tax=Argiope bruennichi TaxID=94029 RepID=A0A8T0G2A8_ARGBR|nr:Retrovirus-related Pol polyprotein like [Argiope bruennichi]